MLFRFLFHCRSCDEPASQVSFPLCKNCAHSLLPSPKLCPRCGSHRCVLKPDECFASSESTIIDSYTARYLLIEPGYSVLKSWKKHGGPVFDQKIFMPSSEFFSAILSNISDPTKTVIVPMPQSFQRSWRLGRSPALIVARWISSKLNIALDTDLLRIKDTSTRKLRQAQLGLERRLQTPSNVFATNRAIHLAASRKYDTILLVDDFMTTGHTLRNGAFALKAAGFPITHAVVLGYRPRQTSGDGFSASDSGAASGVG